MEQFILPSVQLGSTVFITIAFIWYLVKRDDTVTKVMIDSGKERIVLARALQKLTDAVDRSVIEVRKNTPATEDLTDAVGENTDTIKKTNGSTKINKNI